MKAPSIFVSILFAVGGAAAVYLGGAASIAEALQSYVFQFVAALSFVTSAWRLWQEYADTDVEVHTMDREIHRGSLSRAFWG